MHPEKNLKASTRSRNGLLQFLIENKKRFFEDWVITPLVVATLLAFVWIMNTIISMTSLVFPASVACMLLTFIMLILLDWLLPNVAAKIIEALSPGVQFLLKWINILFSPAFILIPMSPSIQLSEVGKIAAVFVIGFVISMAFSSILVRVLQYCNPLRWFYGKSASENQVAEKSHVDNAVHINVLNEKETDWENVEAKSTSSIGTIIDTNTLTNPTKLVTFLESNVNICIYALLLVPTAVIYIAIDMSLPIFLVFNVLCFQLALLVPPRIRKVLHPILICAALMILIVYLISLAKGMSLAEGLTSYSSGTRFLALSKLGRRETLPAPGAGDVLYSMLDASIVALSFNMFKFRKEIREYMFEMLLVIPILSVMTIFLYPIICRAIGISIEHSLAFAGRSITTPLAISLITTIGGDVTLGVILVVLTGISGALVGNWILSMMRVHDDDYLTIGVSMGCNSHAIATDVNPAASAIASASFVLYGSFSVIVSAIPAIISAIRSLITN
ncbi:hypothetical protein K7432_005910 [Basidiobolus ranarum]|uniref:Plastidal glycolate/glycerate translocator 1 n=1 Tax=Basidiobolus ranarum TaxID=34480 RepID=A0ABR2WVR5_9FUNG